MRVLFLFPQAYLSLGISGGISVMGAILKQRGHQVRVFDTTFLKTKATAAGHDNHGGLAQFKKTEVTLDDLVRDDPVVNLDEAFQQTIDDFRPEVIAISSMTATFDTAVRLVRNARHDAIVVAGGIHPTIAPEDAMAQPEIDAICIGEADEVFPELIDRLERGRDHTDILSFWFRMRDGSIRKNPTAPRVQLDDLPTPDWSLFDKRHLFRPFEGKVYCGTFYLQSRGCPMQCAYCVDPFLAATTGGAKGFFRFQAPATTIHHLTELNATYGADWLRFGDDTFLLPPVETLEELAAGIKPLNIMFSCSVMINTITEEKIRLAKEMGCVAMSVGIESGSPSVRQRIRRAYSNDKVVERLKIIQDYGIKLSTTNIIGLPDETRAEVFETIELNRQIKTGTCNVYMLYPYPGTEIQRTRNIPFRDTNGNLIPLSEAKNFRLSKMTPDELEGLMNTFNFYLNLPKTLWPIVQLAESLDEIGTRVRWTLHDIQTALISGEAAEPTSIRELAPTWPEAQAHLAVKVPRAYERLLTLKLPEDMRAVIVSAMASEYGSPSIPSIKTNDRSASL